MQLSSQLTSQPILLVEDDPDHAALALRALRRNKFPNEVVVAHDGAEALDYLFGLGNYFGRDPRSAPRIVVLDLKLPKVDGLEVLRRVRADERTRLIPVVILTSSDEQKDIVDSYSLCVNSYVRKPVDFNEFMETTKQLGAYWLEINDPPPLGKSG